jgi:hypothetical protein
MKGPNAALIVDWRQSSQSDPPYAVYFFKEQEYIRWDVDGQRLFKGYPRSIQSGWPGLLEAVPGSILAGAIHVPRWHNRAFFFFRGQRRVVVWDIDNRRIEPDSPALSDVLPGRLIEDRVFTPLYVDNGEVQRIYAFRGDEYTRWTVDGTAYPSAEHAGYPRKIGDGWTGGLTVAPTCALSVNWSAAGTAPPNTKNYFFLGDLCVRWDVQSHTNNYTQDIASGRKGWPTFG